MPRPRIEFVQSQQIPWQPEPLAATRPGTEARLLSVDDETGACSLVMRYPAGWTLPAGQCLAADEEFLVLDGMLRVGDHAHGPIGYSHLPGGHIRGAMSAPHGALALAFFSAAPVEGPPAPADPARLAEGVDGMHLPYTGNFHPEFPPGAGRRMLYEDPLTGDQTWLLGTMGLR